MGIVLHVLRYEFRSLCFEMAGPKFRLSGGSETVGSIASGREHSAEYTLIDIIYIICIFPCDYDLPRGSQESASRNRCRYWP